MGGPPHQNRAGHGPATGDRGSARIVPFPLAGPGTPEPRRGRGKLVRLSHDRDPDSQRNQAWDGLLTLVNRAWNWRDPDSIAELEARLLELGIAVEADWA